MFVFNPILFGSFIHVNRIDIVALSPGCSNVSANCVVPTLSLPFNGSLGYHNGLSSCINFNPSGI